MKTFLLIAAILLVPMVASAQTVTSYEFRIFAPLAAAPISTTPVTLSSVTCNLSVAFIPPGPALNPTLLQWSDPANPGRFCQATVGSETGGPVFALPSGNYEGAVRALSSGGPGVDSNRDPFVRGQLVPAALTNFRLLRGPQ